LGYNDNDTYRIGYGNRGFETFHIEVPETLRGKVATLNFQVSDGTVYLDDVFFKSEHLLLGNPILNGQEARQTFTNFTNNYLIERPQYALSYSNTLKGSNWVAYKYDRSWLGDLGRPEANIPWTTLPPGSEFGDRIDYPWIFDGELSFANLTIGSDYRRSGGYDRGHMITRSHRNRTQKDQLATYFTSSILPQHRDNNRDSFPPNSAWVRFENFIREELVTNQNRELYIISGGYQFNDNISNSDIENPKQIKIPEYTWKIVVNLEPGQELEDVNLETSTIAIMTPNRPRPEAGDFPVTDEFLPGRVMTINSLEEWRNWQTWRVDYRYIQGLTNLILFQNVPSSLNAPLLANFSSTDELFNSHGTFNKDSIWIDSVTNESTFQSPQSGSSSIDIFQVDTQHVKTQEISSTQISPTQISSTHITPTTSADSTQISSTQISPTQIDSTQVSSTQIDVSQINPAQFSTTQIDSAKVSLPSSVTLEQFLSIHNSFPASVYTLNNSAFTLWNTLLSPTTPFNINLQLVDLPTGQLAEAVVTKFDDSGRPNGGTLLIDHNANDIGWYIDPTPLDHSEFTTTLTDTAFRATPSSPAAGRYDLLTTILHEMGHLSGFISGYSAFDNHIQTLNGSRSFIRDNISATLTPDGSHLDPKLYPYDLMNPTLTPGVRKLPSLINLQILNAVRHSTATASLLATLNILSLLFHTLLELLDQKYKLLRSHLPTRKTFFDDLRGLTCYIPVFRQLGSPAHLHARRSRTTNPSQYQLNFQNENCCYD
jgi:DNA/RNA endonuclease G (NUC1)